MRELAPQAKGSYSRPSDPFISEGMELGDIHYLYTGNGKVVLVLKRKELFSYPDSLLCHSVSTIQRVSCGDGKQSIVGNQVSSFEFICNTVN